MAADLNQNKHDPETCPTCKFAHLHQHTQFSLLDGAARIKDLLKWVKKVSPQDPMLAMTDHGNMFGAVSFYKYATEYEVKPIIGYEAYVAADSRFDRKAAKGVDGGYFHLTLLAQDMDGYQNLCRLSSLAYLEGFYQKPRIDRDSLREMNKGIIALSGCLGAEIPQFIMQERYEDAEKRLQEYLSIFGSERYFIEIQDHGLEEQHKVNKVLKEFADKYGLGIVATNDGHYVRKEDAEAHAVVLAVQSKATWGDPNRWKFPCDEFYVKSPEEMVSTFADEKELWGSRMDELFDNSVNISKMCNVELVPKKVQYRIPKFPLPEGRNEVTYFRELTFAGMLKRYPDKITAELYGEFLRKIGRPVPNGDGEALALELAKIEDLEATRAHLPELKDKMDWTAWEIMSRAVYELVIIEQMGFPGYLLIVSDFINWAKDNGISVGPGRGSAAGSLATYATRITNIDPLAYDLLFERFLNPARVSMPDIDTDFSDVRRGEVIEYTRQRYGDEMVAQIGTFGTLASKAAIKDAARVFGLPIKKADELAKLIPVVFGKPTPLDKAIETIPDLRAEMDKDPLVKRVMEIAQKLEGLNRQSSVHAAGVVISDVPIRDFIPLMRSNDGLGKVTQYDMGSVEALGFLKMDFLGLRTLSFLDESKRIVKESKGVDIDFDTIPVNDELTFEVLGRGETKGVFQLDSAGMTSTVRGLKPRRIQDIIALGALYRPGPMENIPTYIRRHHGREAVEYPQFPNAEQFIRPILEETYGIPVYQEQIMQIASAAAGYSLGEADLLRRCIAAGTLITNAETGERIPIEQVEPGFTILTLAPDYKLVQVEVQERIDNGVMLVYRLKTRSGRSLELTQEHPLLTVMGWQHLSDLKLGDSIAVPSQVAAFGGRSPDLNRMKILAYLLGDGNTRTKGNGGEIAKANFYSSNEDLLEDYQQAVASFGASTKRYVHPKTGVTTITCRGLEGQPNPITALVVEVGLDKRATEKRVPAEVFEYTRASLIQFLGKLWSTDGSIENQRISYSTSSLELIDDLAHLLLRLGIVTMRRSRQTYRNINHELLITDQDDVRRFAETIGQHLVREKREKLKGLLQEVATRVHKYSIYTVPAEIGHKVREAKYGSKVTWAEADQKAGTKRGSLSSGLNLHEPARALSRHRLAQLGQAFESEELLNLAQSNVIWDVIAEIESVGEKQVYDLAVPPFANFVAADVVVHNSMGKKKMEEMQKHRITFKEGAAQKKIPGPEADALFDLLQAFANYGFNKCVSGNTEVVEARSGRKIKVIDIVERRETDVWVFTLCDQDEYVISAKPVVDAFLSGTVMVYRLTTKAGRVLEATDNHPIFTMQGWLELRELEPGAKVGIAHNVDVLRPEFDWDVVASIEPVGVQEVYDLTIQDTHNFVANGLITHNSHSAAYAVLTYQTAYVKAHYPVEFHAALLSVERGDSDKVAEYIRASRSIGVEVLPPRINQSGFNFSAVGETVLFGLSAVKNVGETPTELILKEREKGKFKSLPDFLKRVDPTVANKRVVESLIKSGAFDEFGERGAMLASFEEMLKWAQAERDQASSGMMSLFGESQEPELPKGPKLDAITQLRYEKEALGIYVTGHPLERYEGLREAASCTIEDLPIAFAEQKRNERNRVRLVLAGMIEGIVRKPTKSGGMLIRFNLSDETGAMEIVGFGKAYDRISPRVSEDGACLVVVEVEPEAEGEGLRVVAQDVFPYHELEGMPKVVELEMHLPLVDDEKLLDLRSRMDEFSGSLPVQLKIRGEGGTAVVDAREVKISELAMPLLRELDWLEARLVPDREMLLGWGKAAQENNFRQKKGEDQGPIVPF